MNAQKALLALTAILILLASACGSQAERVAQPETADQPAEKAGPGQEVEQRAVAEEEGLVLVGANDSDCGDGACDSMTLQAALDAAEPGATIRLDGLFDFGKDQFVSLKKDVAIIGTLGPDGEHRTIIRGGTNTFALGWDPALGFAEFNEYCRSVANPNSDRWPAHFVIEDLRFEDATWSAIWAAATTGATIRNNEFSGGYQVNAGCNAYQYGDVPDGSMSAVAFVTNQDARHPVFGAMKDISGEIEIVANYFNGQVREDPAGFDPAHGVSSDVHGETIRLNGMLIPIHIAHTAAELMVRDNLLENIQWGTFFGPNEGSMEIVGNRLYMNPENAAGDPIGFVWAGIQVDNQEIDSEGPVLIAENVILSHVPDFVHGIVCNSQSATVRDNQVTLLQDQDSLWNVNSVSAGIYLGADSRDNVVEGNVIEGSGQSAIVVAGERSRDSVIKGNSVADFVLLEVTDVYCRAYSSTGNCGSVPGAHYHLILQANNNTIIEDGWDQGITLIDSTTAHNPYDPATYDGRNTIAPN